MKSPIWPSPLAAMGLISTHKVFSHDRVRCCVSQALSRMSMNRYSNIDCRSRASMGNVLEKLGGVVMVQYLEAVGPGSSHSSQKKETRRGGRVRISSYYRSLRFQYAAWLLARPSLAVAFLEARQPIVIVVKQPLLSPFFFFLCFFFLWSTKFNRTKLRFALNFAQLPTLLTNQSRTY